MEYKFSSPLKYGKKKKEQNAMKKIMKNGMKLSNHDSKNRVDKVYKDELKRISPKPVSPTARLNNTFGKKKVIK